MPKIKLRRVKKYEKDIWKYIIPLCGRKWYSFWIINEINFRNERIIVTLQMFMINFLELKKNNNTISFLFLIIYFIITLKLIFIHFKNQLNKKKPTIIKQVFAWCFYVLSKNQFFTSFNWKPLFILYHKLKKRINFEFHFLLVWKEYRKRFKIVIFL